MRTVLATPPPVCLLCIYDQSLRASFCLPFFRIVYVLFGDPFYEDQMFFFFITDYLLLFIIHIYNR